MPIVGGGRLKRFGGGPRGRRGGGRIQIGRRVRRGEAWANGQTRLARENKRPFLFASPWLLFTFIFLLVDPWALTEGKG